MEGDDCEQDSGLESPPHSKADSPERLAFSTERTIGSSIFDDSEETATIAPKPESVKPGLEIANAASSEPESYDDEPDETLAERLWGLTEMFPDCVVNATHTVTTKTWSGVKNLYSFSRSAMWIVASTSVILFAPVLFELEIAKNEERQKSEQKQYLLGPSAAMIGPPGATPPLPR